MTAVMEFRVMVPMMMVVVIVIRMVITEHDAFVTFIVRIRKDLGHGRWRTMSAVTSTRVRRRKRIDSVHATRSSR